jgi:DNA-binding CsgD family transcriptional regulator
LHGSDDAAGRRDPVALAPNDVALIELGDDPQARRTFDAVPALALGNTMVSHDDRFVAAIEAIYAAAASPSAWPMALQAIAACSDDPGANMVWRRADGSVGLIDSPGKQKLGSKAYAEHWWRLDIRAQRAYERAYLLSNHAITDRHVVSDEERATHPIYTDFLKSHGLAWFAAVSVSPDPRLLVHLLVVRQDHRPPYSDAELETLTRLGAHAESSLRLAIRLIDAEAARIGLGEAMGRIGIGVFVLDQNGEIVFDNPAGRRLVGDGMRLAGKRLTTDRARERAQLGAAIERMLSPDCLQRVDPPRPLLISRPLSNRPLAVYVLPLQTGQGPAEQFLARGRVIVLAIDSDPSDPPDATVVRDLLGLTLSEARVAALVGCGVAPREAAERLGIAEETARTALKRVFDKVGVSRQSELAALMTKLVLR